MVVKQYLDGDYEILITKNNSGTYNIVKKIKNQEADFQGNIDDIEDALDIFDYWLNKLGIYYD